MPAVPPGTAGIFSSRSTSACRERDWSVVAWCDWCKAASGCFLTLALDFSARLPLRKLLALLVSILHACTAWTQLGRDGQVAGTPVLWEHCHWHSLHCWHYDPAIMNLVRCVLDHTLDKVGSVELPSNPGLVGLGTWQAAQYPRRNSEGETDSVWQLGRSPPTRGPGLPLSSWGPSLPGEETVPPLESWRKQLSTPRISEEEHLPPGYSAFRASGSSAAKATDQCCHLFHFSPRHHLRVPDAAVGCQPEAWVALAEEALFAGTAGTSGALPETKALVKCLLQPRRSFSVSSWYSW